MVLFWLLPCALGSILSLDSDLELLLHSAIQREQSHEYSCKRPSVSDYTLKWKQYERQCIVSNDNAYVSSTYQKNLDSIRVEIEKDFRSLWDAYKANAWGKDSLLPLSGESVNDKGGVMHSLISNLDNLLFMGGPESFLEALNYTLSQELMTEDRVPTAEYISDIVGGLLGTYTFYRKPEVLAKILTVAERVPEFYTLLGEKLLYPYYFPKSRSGEVESQSILTADSMNLAEIALLFSLTGNTEFEEILENMGNFLFNKGKRIPYIFNRINVREFMTTRARFFGSSSADPDSVHLHRSLFNTWQILGEERGAYFKESYYKNKEFLVSNALKHEEGFAFIPEISSQSPEQKHLTMHQSGCALAAQLAYDNYLTGQNSTELALATSLIETCLKMYLNSKTGLSPTSAGFSSNKVTLEDSEFTLNPDLFEALFHMYRLTNDQIFRTSAYYLYSLIKQKCRAQYGYCTLGTDLTKQDKTNPLYMSKALKYLYFLFAPESLTAPRSYLFTSAGHILTKV